MKTKTKRKTVIIILILAITAILATAIYAYYAYSQYVNSQTGNGTATIAKWSFKVNGETEQFATINLEDSMNEVNNMVEKRIAPGTSGAILLELDGTGSEVAIDYSISLNIANKPTNLKMYTDSEYTQVVEPDENGIINITGTIPLQDVGTIQNKYIYWNWPYRTGTTENEIAENDLIDTEDVKLGTIEMPITVTAVQRDPNEQPRLADLVQVGDYVNYDASSNGTKTFTSSDCLTGSSISATISTDDSFNSDALAQWRVLSVDKESGIVELMAADPTAQTVTLSGGDGFVNAETVLNNIGAIYGQGKGATGGRSITVEDVNQYSSYVPSIGDTKTFTLGKFHKEIKDKNGNVVGYETKTTTASTTSPVTMTYTTYSYGQRYFANSIIYNMIFKNSTITSSNTAYWLASRCTWLGTSACSFYVRRVEDGSVKVVTMYDSNNYNNPNSRAYGICPVVSLISNIQTTGQDNNGVWQLKIE